MDEIPADLFELSDADLAALRPLVVPATYGALGNLRDSDAGRTWTHEKRDKDGRLIWVAMMHDDGLGSSRLLCFEEVSAAFPHGYLVALPDRSCGLAVSAGANTAERREFDDMVERSFAGATTPMSDQIMAPEALRLRVT